MKATTAMTREEYINFTINCLKRNARLFSEETDLNMKEFFAEAISKNQCELVKFGFTWEQVEEMEIEAYKVA